MFNIKGFIILNKIFKIYFYKILKLYVYIFFFLNFKFIKFIVLNKEIEWFI